MKNSNILITTILLAAFTIPNDCSAQSTSVSLEDASKRGGFHGFFQRHPRLRKAAKAAAIGAGVGTGVGLITGASVAGSAAMGAGRGAAVSGVRTSKTYAKTKDKLLHRDRHDKVADTGEKVR